MKRMAALLLALAMVLTMAACGSGSDDESGDEAFKIGIITGSVSQSEEEYQTAQLMKEKYGSMIVTATYPDNFSSDKDKLIAAAVDMAKDPKVKAIVWVQAVEGTVDAINKVRQTRDDILFIGGTVADDPVLAAQTLDIAMMTDQPQLGFDIIGQAAKQGAKTFVHISFERHMGIATIAQRQANFIQRCSELGLEYVEAAVPDPIGDDGVSGAQAWITENIKKYVEQYGKDTAFFATNCSMQAPLIQQCAELGAIYPLQCCPSPYHGYPAAFGISDEGHEGDASYMLQQIRSKVDEYGNSGRMSTWSVPVAMMIIEGSVEYAIRWCRGELTERFDEEALLTELKRIGGDYISWSSYVDAEAGELHNFKLIVAPFYDF